MVCVASIKFSSLNLQLVIVILIFIFLVMDHIDIRKYFFGDQINTSVAGPILLAWLHHSNIQCFGSYSRIVRTKHVY